VSDCVITSIGVGLLAGNLVFKMLFTKLWKCYQFDSLQTCVFFGSRVGYKLYVSCLVYLIYL
jgi:hypothetical protein